LNKCFQDFKASGFKRVNLIGGKNNIGKTAFLEACYINVYSDDVDTIITAIFNIKFRREKINLIYKSIDDQKICHPHFDLLKTELANLFN